MSAPDAAAIVLFAHGARDARWARALEALCAEIARLRPQAQLRLAFLESQEPNLPLTLARLAAEGCERIDIAPVFWSAGGHLSTDLPELLTDFAAHHPKVHVRVLPALAELPGMREFLAAAIVAQSGT